jgi:acetyl-CoA carboxylase carboxyltransferase component
MTPDSAMVLTGKQSLDYSGGVSAEDNYGIGGYDRVMGPNGQAQYWAPNLAAACATLITHYQHTYVAPGEDSPRRAATEDPHDRDVCAYPHDHPISDFTTVGDIFSASTNPERKKPFDIRTVMRAVADQDHEVLERWAAMADADTTVVMDAYLGGYPVAVLGVESRPIPRRGAFPTDGPDQWTAGTLFPYSSKKTARAINAASGNRLRRITGVDAQAAARVRGRDRPGHGQLQRPDRLLRHLALPRGRLRGVLRRPERHHGDRRRRGVVRLGDRGRTRRSGRVRP